MPRGERTQTWFPEIVAALRLSWSQDLSWESVAQLRDRLQDQLEDLLRERNIRPAIFRCSECGYVGPGSSPTISVRAMLLALGRFDIQPGDAVRELEKSWAKYRMFHGLDRYGHRESKASGSTHRHVEDINPSVREADT